MSYYEKYLKYKNKYLEIKKQIGGKIKWEYTDNKAPFAPLEQELVEKEYQIWISLGQPNNYSNNEVSFPLYTYRGKNIMRTAPDTLSVVGKVNVREFSREIVLTILGETNLVFSTADEGNFGALQIPNGWTHMFGDSRFFFQIVNYTVLFFQTVVDGKVLVGDVRMFVLFDKGAMHGKILIKDNDGKLEFSLEDWSEVSFIPQDLKNGAELPMIVHERDVWPIEEIDEENGGVIATLVELGDKLFFCLTKLVFDEGTPTHERWVVTLPRMPFWRKVSFNSFERVKFTRGNMMGDLIFLVKIHGEWFPIRVTYQSQGGYIITDPTSLPLFATSTITASLETSSRKVVGEICFLEELDDGSSISEYVFGLPAPVPDSSSRMDLSGFSSGRVMPADSSSRMDLSGFSSGRAMSADSSRGVAMSADYSTKKYSLEDLARTSPEFRDWAKNLDNRTELAKNLAKFESDFASLLNQGESQKVYDFIGDSRVIPSWIRLSKLPLVQGATAAPAPRVIERIRPKIGSLGYLKDKEIKRLYNVTEHTMTLKEPNVESVKTQAYCFDSYGTKSSWIVFHPFHDHCKTIHLKYKHTFVDIDIPISVLKNEDMWD
jgi:hypothetical protein